MTTQVPYNMLDTNAQAALASFRNKLMNAIFAVNQRGYVSAAATGGANEYTLDRWRVVTSGQSASWTDSGGVRTVTVPAGGLEQVIEGNNLVTATHTLNWTGTATATVGGASVTKGSTFSVTGGSDLTVRFTGGTVSNPQLELGEVPTTFERRPYGLELALCQRYFVAYLAASTAGAYFRFGMGECNSTTLVSQTLQMPTPMRIKPALTTTSAAADFAVFHAGTITACSAAPTVDTSSSPFTLNLIWTVASGLTAGRAAALMANNNNTAHIHLSAEL